MRVGDEQVFLLRVLGDHHFVHGAAEGTLKQKTVGRTCRVEAISLEPEPQRGKHVHGSSGIDLVAVVRTSEVSLAIQ